MDYIERILNAKTIPGLNRTVSNFWMAFCEREGDGVLLSLLKALENKTDSRIHRWLYSYLPPCNDGEEFMDALIKFETDCEAFHNVKKEKTIQISEKEFMDIVEECNEVCRIKQLLSEVYDLNIIEADKSVDSQENCYLIVDKTLNIFLPRVPIDTNIKKYIGEILGLLLYELEVQKSGSFRVCKNLRYNSKKIKKSNLTTQELYKICFYEMFIADDNKAEYFIPEKDEDEVANHLGVIISNLIYNGRKQDNYNGIQ